MSRRVKCKSGITGNECHLQENYSDLDEFKGWSETYNLAGRLGFDSAEEAWEANPLIQHSVNPSDFRISPRN